MDNDLDVAQVEVVLRERGADVVVVGLFQRAGGKHDVVAGYPSKDVLFAAAQLLIEIGNTLMSEDWVSVPRASLSDTLDGDGQVEQEDFPF